MPLARAVLCARRFLCFARRQKSDPGKSSGTDDCCSTRRTLISAEIKSEPRFQGTEHEAGYPGVCDYKQLNVHRNATQDSRNWCLLGSRYMQDAAVPGKHAQFGCMENWAMLTTAYSWHANVMLLQTPTAAISTQYHGCEPQRWSNILWGAAGGCKIYVLLKIRASKGKWKHKTKIVRIGLRSLNFLWGRGLGSVAGPQGKEEVVGGLALPLTCCHTFGNSFSFTMG